MPNQWLLEKIWKKKQKKKRKEPENVVEKRKEMEKKKMKDNTNTFIFNDFWVWDWCMFFVLFSWNCFAENFADQFDMKKSGTLV